MKVRIASETPRGEWTRLCLTSKEERGKLVPPPSDREFSGDVGTLLADRAAFTLYAGVGESASLDASAVRRAASGAALALRKQGRVSLLLSMEEHPEFVGAAVEGLFLGGYRFETFASKKSPALSELVVFVSKKDVPAARKAAAQGQVMAEAINASRDVGNLPGNLLNPAILAKQAVQMARQTGLKCRVLDERALKAGKFGGLLAVGAGSPNAPRLIALEHLGGAKGEAPLVLVGKAITFDSGGISIKPASSMEEMIFDKCGGTAVFGAMQAIANLGLKRNVVGILAAAENMPSGTAYRPGDIVTMRSGTTVEVVNTDAEGRMVLGDALWWACNEYKAARVINLATLTGACGVALGEGAAGMWTNDDAFQAQVAQAAKNGGERLWPMPLFPEHTRQIKSQVAHIKNSGGRLGGACTAAAFLKEFVGNTPWVHLDIAYTSHRTKDQDGLAAGATGFGVRTLVELASGKTIQAI
jgi:leucyl aminopeptidase